MSHTARLAALSRRCALVLLLLGATATAQGVPPGSNPFGYGGDPTRPAPMPAKPATTLVVDEHIPGLIEIKFVEGSGTRLREVGFVDAAGGTLDELSAVLEVFGASARRMFAQTEQELSGWKQTGEARAGIVLQDLNLFYFIDAEPDLVGPLCDALNHLDVVALAWPAPSGGDPVVTVVPPTPAAPPAAPPSGPPAAPEALGGTPDFEEQQGYRSAAPTGIDALYGNTFSGGRGLGRTIIDCETGWTDEHEDLVHEIDDAWVLWVPANNPWNHGTAVVGEMIGGDNGFGVKGICWESNMLLSTHTPVGMVQNIPGSVANAAAVAGEGDIIVIEIQCFAGPPSPHPCEYDPAIFASVQTATANGAHVFAAAGNGNQNLDSAAYGGAFDLNIKDSGAVMVGASNGSSLDKAGFSNYGTRCTSHGWGEQVTTAGYADLFNGGSPNSYYTATFSGTSSATPIVTGAGSVLAGIHLEAFGSEIEPVALRTLLQDTGTPQGTGGQIGSRPDLRSAVRELGIPEIEVTGNTGAGGVLEMTSYGEAGDPYLLLWSPSIAATPTHVPPYAYLYLASPFVILPAGGVIGGGGTAVDNYAIPGGSPLSGQITYFQGVQLFNSKPGTGSLSNHVAWRMP